MTINNFKDQFEKSKQPPQKTVSSDFKLPFQSWTPNPKGFESNDKLSLRCDKCGQLYAFVFDHIFYCTNCGPNAQIYKMMESLLCILKSEIEARIYSQTGQFETDLQILTKRVEKLETKKSGVKKTHDQKTNSKKTRNCIDCDYWSNMGCTVDVYCPYDNI